MEKKDLTLYTDFLVEKTRTLLNIDSPTGYTEEAAAWVRSEFEKLGFDSSFTKKGGVLVSFGGQDKENGLLLEAHMDTLGGMVAEIKGNGRPIGEEKRQCAAKKKAGAGTTPRASGASSFFRFYSRVISRTS